MVFPLIVGLVGAGIQAATEAGKAIAAANAPKPISPNEIKGIYDEEQQRATKGAYSQSMHALQSLAGSGGSAGSQASARRAAMLQAPSAMADATMAGFGAGTQSAAARVGDMTGARQRETNQAIDVADRFGRVGHSAGILANDLKSGLVAQEALGYDRQRDANDMELRRELMDRLYPKPARAARRRPSSNASTSDYRGRLPEGYGTGGGGVMSDERSKARIQELETMNASLQAQLAAASGGEAGRRVPSVDQSRRVPTAAEAQISREWGPTIDMMGQAGYPVDIDEIEGLDEGTVSPPPASDPKYDTYVPPKKMRPPLIREVDADAVLEEEKRKKQAGKDFVLRSIAGTIR